MCSYLPEEALAGPIHAGTALSPTRHTARSSARRCSSPSRLQHNLASGVLYNRGHCLEAGSAESVLYLRESLNRVMPLHRHSPDPAQRLERRRQENRDFFALDIHLQKVACTLGASQGKNARKVDALDGLVP